MRILLVTDWNRGRGGAEAYALMLRDSLRANGDDARLLTSSAGTAGDGSADYVALGANRKSAQVFLQIVNPSAVLTVRRALREFRPHIAYANMFAHHLSPAVLHELAEIPTVLLVSDYKCVCPIGSKLLPDGTICTVRSGWVCREKGCVGLAHWLRDQPRYALIRSAVGRVRRVLACSRWVQRELAAGGIPSEILTLPAAAPSPGFLRRPSETPVFVYCGRLDVEKGVPLLVRAFAELRGVAPAAVLRVVGQGPLRADLEGLARNLGLGNSIEFRGWLPPAEVEAQLQDAWATIMPSLWAEPLGLAAAEAILHRVPVVASASGGPGEFVEHGVSGLLFPNNDEAALAACLKAIACGSAFPDHALPEPARLRAAETFSLNLHRERLRRIFASALKESSSPRCDWQPAC